MWYSILVKSNPIRIYFQHPILSLKNVQNHNNNNNNSNLTHDFWGLFLQEGDGMIVTLCKAVQRQLRKNIKLVLQVNWDNSPVLEQLGGTCKKIHAYLIGHSVIHCSFLNVHTQHNKPLQLHLIKVRRMATLTSACHRIFRGWQPFLPDYQFLLLQDPLQILDALQKKTRFTRA